jgi:hypothetical protein
MASDRITFCPRCLKPVEAKEYFSTRGMSDWRADTPGMTISCSKCGYSGLPIQVGIEDYRKLIKET